MLSIKKLTRLLPGIVIIALFVFVSQGNVALGSSSVQHSMDGMDMVSETGSSCNASGCAATATSCLSHCLVTASTVTVTDAIPPISTSVFVILAAIAVLAFSRHTEVTRPSVKYNHTNRTQLLSVMKLE